MDFKKDLKDANHEFTHKEQQISKQPNNEATKDSIVSNIQKDIEPQLHELKGQDPESIYQVLKDTMNKHIPEKEWENLSEKSTIIKIVMPEENEAEPWNKKDGGVVKENLDDALRSTANDISKGKIKSQDGESSKRIKFTVPFGPGELESLRGQGESAKNYIREKIKSAAASAQIDLSDLDRGQKGVNFKNFGSRAASIKTTGHTLLEALTEIIYVCVSQEMNPDQVKGACEQNMGTASNTGMQAGNMIDDMINGTGDEVERNQEGFTFTAG